MNGAEGRVDQNPASRMPYVGCAGWSLPRSKAALFPGSGSHLQRYSGRFAAVEINSSFYHIPAPKTTEKWARMVEPFETR